MGVNALRCPLSFYLGVVHKCWWKKLAGITAFSDTHLEFIITVAKYYLNNTKVCTSEHNIFGAINVYRRGY